jgi:3-hydroxybutyryl-CoA dehydrogenase
MLEVRAIAVIGAGNMGREIAYAAALAGFRTILEDILPTSLRRAESEIQNTLHSAMAQGSCTKEAAESVLARIEYASTVEQAAREADLAIECVPDELESKLEIFTLLDRVCRPGTVLASTSSSLMISEISSITFRPQHCVGLRLTGTEMKLICGAETDEETQSACIAVARKMGREVIVLRE